MTNPIASAKEAYSKRKEAKAAEKAAKELAEKQAQVRKPETVQQEYLRLCGLAGDKQYRIKMFEYEIQQINQEIFKLNQEFETAKSVHGFAPPVQPKVAPKAPVENGSKEVTEGGQSEAAH